MGPTTNKFIVNDRQQILNVVGAYMETIYATKIIDGQNQTHKKVGEYFNRFLEEKSLFDNNPTHIIKFTDTVDSNNMIDSHDTDFFLTREEILFI